jgi:hypothetical protein
MAQRCLEPIRTGWLVLALALSTAAVAAPLRLSLDAVVAVGPTGEVAEPASAGAPAAQPLADDELSFVGTQDLNFPDAAPPAAAMDEDWLAVTRPQQDDTAASADRQLGEFVPPTPAEMVATQDPFDLVELAAPALSQDKARAAEPDLSAIARGREALAWVVAPIVVLAVAAAWLNGRHGSRRRRRGAVAA